MRRVGGQRQVNLLAVELPVGGRAEMIFDVARPLDFFRRRRRALEFGEDRRERLVHDVGEHVQPAAMRHADDDFLDA